MFFSTLSSVHTWACVHVHTHTHTHTFPHLAFLSHLTAKTPRWTNLIWCLCSHIQAVEPCTHSRAIINSVTNLSWCSASFHISFTFPPSSYLPYFPMTKLLQIVSILFQLPPLFFLPATSSNTEGDLGLAISTMNLLEVSPVSFCDTTESSFRCILLSLLWECLCSCTPPVLPNVPQTSILCLLASSLSVFFASIKLLMWF